MKKLLCLLMLCSPAFGSIEVSSSGCDQALKSHGKRIYVGSLTTVDYHAGLFRVACVVGGEISEIYVKTLRASDRGVYFLESDLKKVVNEDHGGPFGDEFPESVLDPLTADRVIDLDQQTGQG